MTTETVGDGKRRLQGIVLFVLLASSGLYNWSAIQVETSNPAVVYTNTVVHTRSTEADERCHFICQERRKLRVEKFNGVDILDPKQVLHAALTSKATMVNNLKRGYGSYFEKIFVEEASTRDQMKAAESSSSAANESVGRSLQDQGDESIQVRYRGIDAVNPPGESVNRLHRKLIMKLVKAQDELRRQESNLDGCDCIDGDRSISGEIPKENTTEYLNINSTYTEFVWAAGGHSSSAGHGNLFNESFTAYLERAIKDVFGSIGIGFIGRNYGMGATGSGLELSMCSEAVYGNDVDFLSWDFGITDGAAIARLLHYFYRASLSPGRPAILGLNMDGRYGSSRVDQLSSLEKMGMSAFWMNPTTVTAMNAAIPDTLGMPEDDIKALPDFVRNFKCSGQIEKGDPYCFKDKYNEFACPKRKGKAHWHPGYKVMAMDGTRLALFLAQTLTDALSEYVKRESHPKPEDIMKELLAEEDLRYQEFKAAPLPDAALAFRDNRGKNQQLVVPSDIDVETLFRGPNICHTARTPAQTRFLGILTDTDKVGGVAVAGYETYEVGITHTEASTTDAKGEMRLVYHPDERDRQNCSVPVNPDYKDYFFAHGKDGWVKLVIPNKSEMHYYNYDPAAVKGILVIYFGTCKGKCPPDDMQLGSFIDGLVEFEVNGKPVTSLTQIGGGLDGILLKGEHGVNWPPNNEGLFEIRSKVNNAKGYLRLMTVVLY